MHNLKKKSLLTNQIMTTMQENNNEVVNTADKSIAISNGRNKRRCTAKVEVTPSSPTCGVIENISSFTEKLSGQHSKGYAETNKDKKEVSQKESPVAEQKQNDVKSQINDVDDINQDCKCTPKKDSFKCDCDENQHKGPSFEEAKSNNKRTLEVSLKKVPCKSEKVGQDAISYSKVSASISTKEKLPSKGILASIKSLISKIFSKKSSKKKNSKKFNNEGSRKKNYNRKNNFSKDKDSNKEFKGRSNNYKRKNYNNRSRNPNYKKNNNQSAQKSTSDK